MKPFFPHKRKDVGDGSRVSGCLKKSNDVDESRVCGGLKKWQDVVDGCRGGDVGDGCGGSLSSSFKRKVVIADDCDDGLPFGKRALYYYHPEDKEVVQETYGLATEAELVRLIDSICKKDDQIVSPNIRFTYGAKPYTRDCDPRIAALALQKEQVLSMARSGDRAAFVMTRDHPLKRSHLQGNSLLPRKPALPKGGLEEIWRKRFERWEENQEERLKACDLSMATKGLAYFNLKFKTDYIVEEVLGSQEIAFAKGCFFHGNFIARSKKDSQQCLFFVELQNSVEVSLCCILDENVRGCHFCGNEFVHPSVEGLIAVGM